MQLNSWAVYNWENKKNMTHKMFILKAVKGILKEIGEYESDTDDDSEDLLSPTAAVTPVPHRFKCNGEKRGSIAKSKHWK